MQPLQTVTPGTPLYRINSTTWRSIQQRIADIQANISRLSIEIESFPGVNKAHGQHARAVEELISTWASRIERLETLKSAGGGNEAALATARAQLAQSQSEMAGLREEDARLIAEQARAHADLKAARVEFALAVDTAATLTGLTPADLLGRESSAAGALPRWRAISEIEVPAVEPGTVESIALPNGAWVDERAAILSVVRPDQLRFVASAVQGDLGLLRPGLSALIVPPAPTSSERSIPLDATMTGTLEIGVSADPDANTIDLFVTPDTLVSWARPGVVGQLEIVTASESRLELAVPLTTIQRDGLVPVLFRRDPDQPNQAIRIEADLGLDDGRWVAVLSGLRDGDQVVMDGAFQLMLATSGQERKGGHFHADGTYHEGDH